MLIPPPKKHLLFLDAETYYGAEYSLRKMPTPNYILDPRFELIMMAVKADDGPHEIISGPDFGAWLSQFDPAVTTTVTFNSLFDNSILAWHYGFVPNTMVDAMGMARALLGHQLTSFSLRSIAEFLHLGVKGNSLHKMTGLTRQQIIDAGLWDEFCIYALQDNHLCEQIFLRLYPAFPRSERRLMDLTLRTTVQPRFRVDIPLLTQHIIDVKHAKQLLLQDAAGIEPTVLMSTKKFKEALEARGVEVEMKISPTTGKETPAFAKTDEFMTTLLEHHDPAIAALAAARLGLKSTLEETRAEKLLSIAQLPWATLPSGAPRLYSGGTMPIPLRYGGAHTHRLSGDWGMNMQNMPTVRGSKGKSKLRQSLICAPDEDIVTCDLAQIEARLVAWICGCTKLVDEFANKKDPYNLLATSIFGREINRKLPSDAIEGFIGKTGILGLGYGCGKVKFDTMVRQSARSMGMDISEKYTTEIGERAVAVYRARYPEIPRTWDRLNNALSTYWLSGSSTLKFGPVEITYGNVLLPSELSLKYADPKMGMDEAGRPEFRYRYGKFWHKLYGAKLLENIVQALARIVVMNASLRIRDRGKYTSCPMAYRYALQAHDELVFICPKTETEALKKVVLEEMRRRPSWAEDAPIDAELGQGSSYGEAK